MDVKVGDKFLRVWHRYCPVAVVEVTCVRERSFDTVDSMGFVGLYNIKNLKMFMLESNTKKLFSIVAPLNQLNKLMYLGE